MAGLVERPTQGPSVTVLDTHPTFSSAAILHADGKANVRPQVRNTSQGGLGTIGSDWRVALLTSLGAPVTPSNLAALTFWAQSEDATLTKLVGANNPLAITDPHNQWPHSGVLADNGGNPVYGFPSPQVGGQALAAFLLHNNYGPVVAALRNDAGLAAIFGAVNQSGWCRGCQGGRYPVALANKLNYTGPDPGAGAGGSTSTSSADGSAGPIVSTDLSVDSLKAGARDLIQLVLGVTLIWVGVSAIKAALTGSGLPNPVRLGASALSRGAVAPTAPAATTTTNPLAGSTIAAQHQAPDRTAARARARLSQKPLPSSSTVAGYQDQAEQKFLLEQQTESEARPRPSVRTVKPGGTPRMARSHRAPRGNERVKASV
jgi:hypothetical protein